MDSRKYETSSSDDNVCVLPALTLSLNRVETSLTLSLSLSKGEATVLLAGEAPTLQHILIALWLRRRNIVTSRVVSWRYPGRLALFKGEGRVRDDLKSAGNRC